MSEAQSGRSSDSRMRSRAFFLLLVLTLSVMISLQIIGTPLQTEAAPSGIISYEFAGTLEAALAMIDSWDSHARISAGLSLGLDYLFLALYSVTIALGCRIVARKLHPRYQSLIRIGALLAWAQFFAAALDALENYALIRLLLGSQNGLWPPVALWSAVPKFAIVLAGILYVLAGGVMAMAASSKPA